ncbi:MAG TPA: hypothetical protein VJ851_18355 [Jatrophihabitans sp.]|nr:hypothetical protein [Jatrophihabitans sp.]
MTTVLAVIATGLLVGAAGLMFAMFRRDESILGVAALAMGVAAGFVSVLYAGLEGA